MYDGSLYMLLVLGVAIVTGGIVGFGWQRVTAPAVWPFGGFQDGFWVAAMTVVFVGGVAGWWLTQYGWLGWYYLKGG